ncbi:MAG: PleD family two-component system response regulator [Hyphomicrobiales bacterium]|nr:PleD family two-component system response regulator [Hyphomicrobiales bacterium]
MTARVLVVDDMPANRRLLEARLAAEYFETLSASGGADAIEICREGRVDIVLLDVMMPGIDGVETCRRLKADPATAHVPVVMVTALDQPVDRVRALDAGADDFLTKPIDEVALVARVRSLARLKVVVDELRLRAATSSDLGMSGAPGFDAAEAGKGGKILVVEDRPNAGDRLVQALSREHSVSIETDAQRALIVGAESGVELFVVSLGLETFDALRLCSQIRSLERTRQTPILLVAEPEDRQRVLRGLDIGVNDWLARPVDRNELLARVRTQLRRKRYAEGLRDALRAGLEMAVVDPLTGLNNRRYFDTHLGALIATARRDGKPLSLVIVDVDHFKSVNDRHGHHVGDQVLQGIAARIRKSLRGSDLVCRLGGEEFAIVMPETPIEAAVRAAERMRLSVETGPLAADDAGNPVHATVSAGLAAFSDGLDAATFAARADAALYRAKETGRNRVERAAA